MRTILYIAVLVWDLEDSNDSLISLLLKVAG